MFEFSRWVSLCDLRGGRAEGNRPCMSHSRWKRNFRLGAGSVNSGFVHCVFVRVKMSCAFSTVPGLMSFEFAMLRLLLGRLFEDDYIAAKRNLKENNQYKN